MKNELFSAVDAYVGNLFAPPDPALTQALADAAAAGLPAINVTPSQGALLAVLARLCGAHAILEIGTLGGYSAIWLARALPASGRLVSLEFNPRHAEVARANVERAGLAEQVEIRVGPALDLLPQLEAEGASPFDMVFIDADKPSYTEYLAWSLRLARPGTLIVADNVLREGGVLDANSTDANVLGIQRFNAALAAEPRVQATIVPMVGQKGLDGIAIAVVRGV